MRSLTFILGTVILWALASCTAKPPESRGRSEKAVALHEAMDKLWNDHVVYTRLFIVDAAAGLPEQQATTERLLRNQDDIGAAVASYYGPEAGQKLMTLLHEHITTAGELVTAAKANDTTKVADAKTRWGANADSIAAFLSAANPKWPQADMTRMMHEHLDLTTEEATAQLHSDWNASIAAYDKVHTQILGMADMLSDGIVAQFPDKF
ncbi:MAG TPA: hypothetical protein VFD83_02235 [Candidatus Polarisedimenticolia bacterium]|nr:hypothetical protein [Candidatus Polarisedimenticolia bacterium]